MTYRDETATLRAEVERFRAENSALRAKPARVPMRWTLSEAGKSDGAGGLFLITTLGWLADALGFVGNGAHPAVLRGAAVCAVATLLWALAFVRRVPAAEVRS